jgi:arylformamidase
MKRKTAAIVACWFIAMASWAYGASAPSWIDISLPVVPNKTPIYPGNPPVTFNWALSLEHGDVCNLSDLHFGAHTGTHIDAPLHFIANGQPVDQIPLDKLIGPARVLECPRDATLIDVAELDRLPWRGASRLLFKTHNSYANYNDDPAFHRDFTAIAPAAARRLAQTGVELVGIDYLSIEKFGSKVPETHRALLGNGVVIVEGLDLRPVGAGDYELICLPARLVGREAAPTRAVVRPLR